MIAKCAKCGELYGWVRGKYGLTCDCLCEHQHLQDKSGWCIHCGKEIIVAPAPAPQPDAPVDDPDTDAAMWNEERSLCGKDPIH